MECHRCKERAAVAAGKFKGVAFEQTPCGQCELRECSIGTLAFDDEMASDEPDAVLSPYPDEHEAEQMLPVSVMTSALAVLLALDAPTRDALCKRHLGARYREIAQEQGVTLAAVEMRHKRALQRWPELQALFPAKVAKQARRKRVVRSSGTLAAQKCSANKGEQGVAVLISSVG
jgi:hypothetical protein